MFIGMAFHHPSHLLDFDQIENPSSQLSEMEMAMQLSSYAHEYARLELQGASSYFEKHNLLEKLDNYRRAYFSARHYFQKYFPERLEEIEKQLSDQKIEFFPTFSA